MWRDRPQELLVWMQSLIHPLFFLGIYKFGCWCLLQPHLWEAFVMWEFPA
jgi:hypothetical protein